MQERATAYLAEQRQQEVLVDRVLQDQALLATVFKDEGDAGPLRAAGAAQVDLPTTDADLARVEPVDPEQTPRELCSAASHEAGEAEDLAGAQLERDAVDPRAGLQVGRLE